MDYFGKNRVKIMIIDRIRSTEYPGKREFRLFFCAPGKGKIFLIENAYILFYDCSSRQRQAKNVWKHFFAALPK